MKAYQRNWMESEYKQNTSQPKWLNAEDWCLWSRRIIEATSIHNEMTTPKRFHEAPNPTEN